MVILDTNPLIRYFTNDDVKKALAVKKLLDEEKEIIIPEVVFPEIEYVLTNLYNTSREKLLSIFLFLISRQTIQVTSYIKDAVNLFGKTSLDMADCIIVSYTTKGKFASFDKKLLKHCQNSYWK